MYTKPTLQDLIDHCQDGMPPEPFLMEHNVTLKELREDEKNQFSQLSAATTTDELHTALHWVTVAGISQVKPLIKTVEEARDIYRKALKLIKEIGGNEWSDEHPTNPSFSISWLDVDSEFLSVEACLRFSHVEDGNMRIYGSLEAD